MTRLVLAWLHLLALAIGVGAVWSRARCLLAATRESLNRRSIQRALAADTWWGLAAGLWIVTGVWRVLASMEKSTAYYLGNRAFFVKMGLFVLVVAIEIWPMTMLIKWRTGQKQPTTSVARRIEKLSYLECVLVIAMMFAAVAMARGYGSR